MPSRRPDLTPALWMLAASTVFFLAAAFARWVPWRADGPLRDAHPLLRGHPAWQLLSLATTGCFYVYECSQRRPAT